MVHIELEFLLIMRLEMLERCGQSQYDTGSIEQISVIWS